MAFILLLFMTFLASSRAAAGSSLDLGASQAGLSLGNSPQWTGVRLNFRDADLESIRGLNLTLWRPRPSPGGEVSGLAVGLWGSRAERLRGIHMGGIGLEAARGFQGVGVSLVGVAVGGDHDGWRENDVADANARGVFVAGIVMGVGGDLSGIAVGGLGAGVGRDARGLMIGGLGMGVGRSLSGVAIAGLGFGIGEDARGLLLSGLGAGIGRDFRGIAIGGLGLGVGGEMRGIAVGGLGVGAESTRGLTLAGLKTSGTRMVGVTVSAYNRWEESMSGVAVALLNVTQELHGVQLGVINIVWKNPKGRRVLPLVNWGG
jgi:hypothetical protein